MSPWNVFLKKKTLRDAESLPALVKDKLTALINDLKLHGKYPGDKWQNYSKLGKHTHHCHLTYHYVACWKEHKDKIKFLEVYYVGSREDASY